MSKFDKQLEAFSHRLTLIRILKNQLSTCSNEIYKTIMMSDSEGKGFFTARQIQMLWMQNRIVEQSVINRFIAQYFPVEKISYSLIARFVCFREEVSQQLQKIQTKKIEDNVRHIKQIFNLELVNYVTYCYLIQQIMNFIPCVGTKPTKSQFEEYVICKQLVVDSQAVSKALFLAQISQPVPTVNEPNRFQNDLGEPSVQNIQRIMQRLKNKVSTFGNEWLN